MSSILNFCCAKNDDQASKLEIDPSNDCWTFLSNLWRRTTNFVDFQMNANEKKMDELNELNEVDLVNLNEDVVDEEMKDEQHDDEIEIARPLSPK